MNSSANVSSATLAINFPAAHEFKTSHVNIPCHQDRVLVNGEQLVWHGATRDVYSPIHICYPDDTSRPLLLGTIPVCGKQEAEDALNAALTAYQHGRGEWPSLSVLQRIRCVEHFVEQLLLVRSQVIELITLEIAKSQEDATKEFDRTISYISDTIVALKRLDNEGSAFQSVENVIAHVRYAPLGVTLCMGPYNYPMNETFATLIPALLMGNVVLIKPPKFGALLYYPMFNAFQKAFPKGVVNFIYGKGAEVVTGLMETGKVDALAFIGSSKVADQLKKAHPASNRLRSVLGLDAKNAALILPDADLDNAVKECVAGALSFNGQRCTAIKIIFVHSTIREEFLRKFSAAIDALSIGMPWESGVKITPMPDAAKVSYLTACVEDAVEKGASVMNSGGGTSKHTLFTPAVLFPVSANMRVYHEEQFGPIVPVLEYSDIQTFEDYIISSEYGQQVSIFGRESASLASLIDFLVHHVCRVNLNKQCQRGPDVLPFSGRKNSAEGTLSIEDALKAFSIQALVATKQNEHSKHLLSQITASNSSNYMNIRYIL